MLYSYNWLKEYIEDLPPPRELAEALTMTGTEVESVADLSSEIKGVVVAEILSVEPHPNADKLTVCSVRTDRETYGIVCGAANMKSGDRVALALDGAVLPGGIKLKKAKIRGVTSQGMMCSEVELGLAESSEGIMILSRDAPLGADIPEALGLKDFIMDIGVTPNRADILSIRGLAREAAAVTGKGLREKEFKVAESDRAARDIIKVAIEADAPCRRYAARVVEGLIVGPSPDHIKTRLESHGLRPVNNVVDITNYVLLELGHPLHAFDLDKVHERSVRVRLAEEGEGLETIDNRTRTLRKGMLVIADPKAPLAVAGVMGGKSTEVTEETRNILIESAWFEPTSIRKTSRALSLSSDSSYRFERGADIENVVRALDMAASMMADIAGGSPARGIVDVYPKKFEPLEIRFRIKRAEELLGVGLEESRVVEAFGSLGITAGPAEDGEMTVRVPSFRVDLKEEADLVEEVARLYGYENIPTTLPEASLSPGRPTALTEIRKKISGALVGSGFSEVVNYSFVSRDAYLLAGGQDPGGVVIVNPLTEEQVVMRCSLMPSLLENLRKNLLKKTGEVRVFEVAPVFLPFPGERLPREDWRVTGLMYGHRWDPSWNLPSEPLDYYDIKGVVETLLEAIGIIGGLGTMPVGDEQKKIFHPGKSASCTLGGKPLGVFGEIHPDLSKHFDLKGPAYLFELSIEPLIEAWRVVRRFKRPPRFPSSERDVAFVVNVDIPYGEIINSIELLDTKLIEKVDLFDVYYGSGIPEGKRSLALRITYRSPERTLKQAEVDRIHSRVTDELTSKFGAVLRGQAHTV